MNERNIRNVIESLNLTGKQKDSANELIPKAMAKAQTLTQNDIEDIKADLGEERLKEIQKILSQTK